MEMRRIGNIYDDKYSTGYAGNVWDKKGIAPTLMTMQGGNRQPFIIVEVQNESNREQQNKKMLL